MNLGICCNSCKPTKGFDNEVVKLGQSWLQDRNITKSWPCSVDGIMSHQNYTTTLANIVWQTPHKISNIPCFVLIYILNVRNLSGWTWLNCGAPHVFALMLLVAILFRLVVFAWLPYLHEMCPQQLWHLAPRIQSTVWMTAYSECILVLSSISPWQQRWIMLRVSVNTYRFK